MRAYLAFWVVFTHVLSRYSVDFEGFYAPLWFVQHGPLAVDMFIIISGFVIFFLLDHRREGYVVFIVRRFFRLWPLFIILYLVGVIHFTVGHAYTTLDTYLPYLETASPEAQAKIRTFYEREGRMLDNVGIHTLLHATMLHGTVPARWLQNAPGAFLYPGWSVSLEWQFYLIAPLVFAAVLRWWRRYSLPIVLAVLFVYTLGRFWPHTTWGAALPMHIEYFFIGCLSYFLYDRLSRVPGRMMLWPYAGAFSIMVYVTAGKAALIPVLLWVWFFCLILDRARVPDARSTVLLAGVFNNPVTQYLGKISYSIYLSHVFALTLAAMTFKWLGIELTPGPSAFFTASALTALYTIAMSVPLYSIIEVRGIKIGNELAKKLAPPGGRPDRSQPYQIFPSRSSAPVAQSGV